MRITIDSQGHLYAHANIGLRMTAQAIDLFVASRRIARDLSHEQNKRLRPLVQRLLSEHKNQEELAAALGMKQSTLSGFLGGRQGTSFAVALRACQLAKENPFAILGIAQDIFESTTAAARAMDPSFEARVDPPVGPFLLRLRRMPGLERWIEDHPTTFTISQIATAMFAYDESKPRGREDGQPLAGWEAYIRDAINVGDRPARLPSVQVDADDAERKQLSPAARRALQDARKKR